MQRARGNYELLLTDEPDATVGGASVTAFTSTLDVRFRNASLPSPAICIKPFGVLGENMEGPQDRVGQIVKAGQLHTVRVFENDGFTTIIPLWDNNLAQDYDNNVGLLSLRGYILPQYVRLQQNGAPIGTGRMARVRCEILPLDVSESVVWGGSTLNEGSAVEPYLSFSRAGQRKQIWWQREWLMGVNNTGLYTYWGNDTDFVSDQDNRLGGAIREPRFADLGCRGYAVHLKPRFRITRERWPVLAVSVAMNWPSGSVMNLSADVDNFFVLNGDEGSAVLLDVNLLCRLRAYLRR